MGYLEEALQRANLQSLREYLLYGVNGEEHTARSYEMRIKKSYQKWNSMVSKYDELGEESELYHVINDVLCEHKHVYMEVGIQAGYLLSKDVQENIEAEQNFDKYREMYSSLFQDVTKAIEELQEAQKEAEKIYMSNTAEGL